MGRPHGRHSGTVARTSSATVLTLRCKVRSFATQGQHGGGRGPRYGAGVSTMRPTHDLSRCAPGFLAGALGAASGLSGTVPLLALPTGTSTLVGSSGRGTRTHLRLFGSSVGTAGRRGALRTGGTTGAVAPGREHQRDGRVAGGPAIGTGGGQLQRGPEPVSRRQPQ